MAYYAALASLTNLLHDIISQDRYPNYLLRKQPLIKSLHQKFNFLEESLQDYSFKGDEAGDRVERRIRELAHRVEDIIETEITYQYQIDSGEDITPCSCMFCRRELDLEEVEQEVESIVEDLTVMKESHGSGNLQPEDHSANIGTSEKATAGTNMTVGLDGYLIAIKDQLCESSSQLQIIPIVGMAGIGKTTLARKSFNDSLVSYHFYLRAWTTISQEYSVKRVLQSILKSLDIKFDDLSGEDDEPLKERIYKTLKGQKYLIVIDDVWSTKVLGDMMRIFPNDSNGSRILLTTRLLDVAQYAATNSNFIHEMQVLNADQSWNLLKVKVFAQECCPQELEDIGKLIAINCGGLPLAIVVIAGVLSDSQTLQYWEKVASNVTSILNRDDEQIFNIVSLSFNHLSHQLKACFLYMGCFPEDLLYMGCFPEDHPIKISHLAQLWIAEGFLKLSNGFKALEQAAEECLVNLVKRNLVIITRRRKGTGKKYCTLHDVLREFCRKRALNEYFFHGIDWERHLHGQGTENVRRIISNSYACEPSQGFDTTLLKLSQACGTCKPVRSIHVIDRSCQIELGSLKLLRLLEVGGVYNTHFKYEVSHLFLLKYLHLPMQAPVDYDYVWSILKLPNLETFIVDGILSLPSQFWHMPRLRHLISLYLKLPPIIEGQNVGRNQCSQAFWPPILKGRDDVQNYNKIRG